MWPVRLIMHLSQHPSVALLTTEDGPRKWVSSSRLISDWQEWREMGKLDGWYDGKTDGVAWPSSAKECH